MNARLYDSILDRFLQVDNYIQDPTNTQNYNQYGYVVNNPLKYTDPSGNAFGDGKDCVNCGGNNYPVYNPDKMQDNKALANGIQGWVDGWASARNIDEAGTAIGKAGRDLGNFIGRNIRSIFGGKSRSSGPPPNMSSYASLNNASFAGGQTGMNTQANEIKNDNFIGKSISTGLWGINTAIGGVSTYMVETAQFYKMNEIWHVTKTAGTSFFWQARWQNPGAMYHRANQIAKVQNARNLSTKLTKVGGALLVADIALSGSIKPSHVINGAMLGASTTGVGSIVAGIWFVADFGTMGVNYLIYNEARGLGDIIDESNFGKTITIQMYEGLY